jgi:fido (protein-threonine AMPylation protein)
LEFVATAGRIAQWHRRIAAGTVGRDDVDFAVAHQHVFADLYGWAGRYRVTELRRGDVLFAWQSEVAPAMQRVGWAARRLAATGAELDDGPLAYRFARLYAEYNRVHPFREGNGRTGTLVLHTVAALCGRRLDLGAFNRDEWIDASRDSMPPRRDGRAGHRPFLPLSCERYVRKSERRAQAWIPAAKGVTGEQRACCGFLGPRARGVIESCGGGASPSTVGHVHSARLLVVVPCSGV